MLVGVVIVIVALGGFEVGCTKPNPAVCCVSEADCASIGTSDPERTCALGLVCADHQCSVPPDGPTVECTMDNECSSPTPRCAPDLQCVECVDAADCPPNEPTCNTTSHECRTCALDADCASEICDVPLGVCVPESSILYAAPNGTSVASCGRNDRCSIQRAFIVADSTRPTIKLAPGLYTANLIVANKTIDVHGAGATISSTTGDTLTVNDTGSLGINGGIVTSSSAAGTAIDCKSLNNIDVPRLSVVDAQIESNARGVRLSHCAATLRRASVHAINGSPLFGISQSTADIYQSSFQGAGVADEVLVSSSENSFLHFTNSIIGSGPATGAGSVIAIGGGILLSYSTVINATGLGVQTPVVCVSGATANGLCIENSIVANFVAGAPANTVTGAGSIVSYSIAFPQSAALAGPGNKSSNPMLTSPSTGDFHLQAGSPAIDAADPSSTQMIDYSGKPRPQGSGRDIGAFEYP